MSRACGLHVARAKRDSQLNRPKVESRPLRQVMCRLDVPRDDNEVLDRMHVWATVQSFDTFGMLVGGRPSSIENYLNSPLHYIPAGNSNVSFAASLRYRSG